MNKAARDKRKKVTAVAVATAAVLAGLWLGLISPQQKSLQAIGDKCAAAERKLKMVKQTIEGSARLETELADQGKHLAKLEEGMATGDLYSWAITTIRQFKVGYKVEIPQFSQIDGPKDVSLLPDFPYQQATLTIGGSAYFYDFGRFLADFENQFPYMRVANLSLEPASALLESDREKLSFKMDIIALVKPNA